MCALARVPQLIRMVDLQQDTTVIAVGPMYGNLNPEGDAHGVSMGTPDSLLFVTPHELLFTDQ